ncbi:hypothetical protein IFR05_017167, partial [Cadophora sp. M221]
MALKEISYGKQDEIVANLLKTIAKDNNDDPKGTLKPDSQVVIQRNPAEENEGLELEEALKEAFAGDLKAIVKELQDRQDFNEF